MCSCYKSDCHICYPINDLIGMCPCGGCDGSCKNAYPELRRIRRIAKNLNRKARRGIYFTSFGAFSSGLLGILPGNYITRTYRIRRRYGFPFSCLTFRDRYR